MEKAALKIKDNSGVSILLALLFVFVAVLVSAVVTSGAATASRNVIYKNDRQKAYLTVYSAADVVCSEIQKVELMDGEAEKNEETATSGNPDIAKLLKTAKDAVDESGMYTTQFSVTAEGSGGEKFDQVNVNFQMGNKSEKKNYDIIMDFSLADGHTAVGSDTNYNLSVKLKKVMTDDDKITWQFAGNARKGQRVEVNEG